MKPLQDITNLAGLCRVQALLVQANYTNRHPVAMRLEEAAKVLEELRDELEVRRAQLPEIGWVPSKGDG